MGRFILFGHVREVAGDENYNSKMREAQHHLSDHMEGKRIQNGLRCSVCVLLDALAPY